MKKLFLSLFLGLALSACADKNDPESLVKGSWELIAIQSSWTGEVTQGSEMYFSQTYQFRSDGTFTKNQRRDGDDQKGSGTFTVEQPSANEIPSVKYYLILNYKKGDKIAGDCQGGEKEFLLYLDTEQIQNTWGQCDGPNLTYEKQK